MIEYVVAHNPDDRVLTKASRILELGGLVSFPVETNWVVAASPFSKKGVEKLYRLRHEDNTKHFSILCHDFKKAMEIALIDDHAYALLKRLVPGPYTFIFNAQKKITKHLKASKYDKEVGIRFPPTKLCEALLKVHGEVLIASHITSEMLELNENESFIYSALIEDYFGQDIDLIIDSGEIEFTGPTSIIDFTSGPPEIIRAGSGSLELFSEK